MTVLHDNLGNPIDAKNPLPVDVNTSDAIVPTDIQSHLQSTIQTHNAVSIPLSGSSFGNNNVFYDTDGFDKIAVNVLNDASTANSVELYWSTDGVTQQGYDFILSSASSSKRSAITDTKARYVKVNLINGDATLAHTMSAWVYLKS